MSLSPLIAESELPSYEEVNVTRTRFLSAPWLNKAQESSVLLAGCGGIGSWVALLLSRIGVNLTLIDDDLFEAHNISGQFIHTALVGRSKVEAVALNCEIFGGKRPSTLRTRITNDSSIQSKIVITGFDNMDARKSTFTHWYNYIQKLPPEEKTTALYIDGRLSATAYQIYVIRGDQEDLMKKYSEEALFDNSEADATVCSFKQTSHLACLIAGKIASFFVNYCDFLDSGVWTIPYSEEFDIFFPSQLLKV